VSQKGNPLKLFAIFSLKLNLLPWNLANLLPVDIHTSTPIWVNLMFNKTALSSSWLLVDSHCRH